MKVQQNSFQKNGLLNINNSTNQYMQDPNKLGRRDIADIKDDMLKAKMKKIEVKKDENNTNVGSYNNQSNMNQRIDYLKRLDNINRWK